MPTARTSSSSCRNPLDLWSFAPDGRSVVGVTWIDGDTASHRPPPRPGGGDPPCWTSICRSAGRSSLSGGVPGSDRRTPRRSLSRRSRNRMDHAGSTCTTWQRARSERSWSGLVAATNDHGHRGATCTMSCGPRPASQIIYRLGAEARIVAADGSGDRASDDGPRLTGSAHRPTTAPRSSSIVRSSAARAGHASR